MYKPGDEPSVHLTLFPVAREIPRRALAKKWDTIRDVRRVVTGALELERAAKNIGSSLEASPVIYVSDRNLLATLFDVDLAEVCITSNYEVQEGDGPARAPSVSTTSPASPSWSRRRGHQMRAVVENPARRSARTRSIPMSRRATPRRCANGRRWG